MEDVTSFHAFERRGWSAPSLSRGYHDHLAPVTTQALPTLLEAAAIAPRNKVADIATGAGYAAGAAARLGADAVGVDFSETQLDLGAPALSRRLLSQRRRQRPAFQK